MGIVTARPSAGILAGSRRLLCAVAIGAACVCDCSIAAPSEEEASESAQYVLKIEHQPLGVALQQFAKQSGVQIVFFSRITEGLLAPALEGRYTLPAAMDRLLAGSKLTFHVINSQTVEVRPSSDTTREPVALATNKTKSGRDRAVRQSNDIAAKSGRMEEVLVIGSAEQLVATRVETPLRLIPQTVSIASPEQIRQQNSSDLADVLRHAPGITMVRRDSLDQDFYSRAYQITSFHADGGAALQPRINSATLYRSTPDLSEFDHVEVLRGADALFGGNGNPGGTVSLVRKRPHDNYSLDLSAVGGSWDNQRIEVDVGGPLAFDGALRGRVDALYSHHDYFYETAEVERKKIFAVLEYDFTPTATLAAGGSYQWDDAVPFIRGLPMYADGNDPRLPRKTSLAFDWAYQKAGIGEAYLQYRQAIGDHWALKLNVARWRTDVKYAIGDFEAQIDPITNTFAGQTSLATRGPNSNIQSTADATLTGVFDWFGWRQEIAVGGDSSRLQARFDLDSYVDFGPRLSDLRAFNPRDYPDPRLTQSPLLGIGGISTVDQYGIFASLRVYFNDAWSVVGGARIGSDSIDTKLTARVGSRTALLRADLANHHVVTPHAGVMYAINDRYSWYASYASIYDSPVTTQRRDGSYIDAVDGVNVETGIKGSWRNGALNGSLVVYRIAQRNLPMREPLPAPPGFSGDYCCYVTGISRSRGVDLELSGEVTPGWLIAAGYTYNTNVSEIGAELSTSTPKHLLKLWTSKQLQGALNRWTVGGTLEAQSMTSSGPHNYCPPRPAACRQFDVLQNSYAVVDLRAAFQIDPNWEVALSVNNAFDKVYYETLGPASPTAWYGEPRNLMVRIDGRY